MRIGEQIWKATGGLYLGAHVEALDAQVRVRQTPLVLEGALSGVPKIHFYAGVPVGEVGVLAVADVRERSFSPEQRLLLEMLGELVAHLWRQEQAQRVRSRLERLLRGKAEMLEHIAKGRALPEVLDRIARWLEAESDTGALVSILVLHEDRVFHGAAPSLPEAYCRAIDGQRIGPAAGTCGTAAYHRTTVVTEDIATDPRWTPYRELALAHGLRACWSTPVLASDGEVLGTFALYYRKPGPPDTRDRELVALATHLTAVALERARQQALLQAREQQLTAVLEQAGDAMLMLDAAQRIVLFNRAAERLFACRAVEVLGQPVLRLLPGLDETLTTTETPVRLAVRRCDGTRFTVELSATTITRGHETDTLLIVRDLTERLRYEAELIRAREEAETMHRLKSALLTNLSHEFRTPLTAVIGFANLIREEVAAGTRLYEFATLISDGARRLLRTLDEVLDLAQLEARSILVQRQCVCLPDALQSLLATYRAQAEQKGLQFLVQPGPLVEVQADPNLLERAVEHLLDNAIKFTERGQVRMYFQQQGSQAGIVIEDTGPGIAADALSHMFNAFWQGSSGLNRTHEGLGLGLTIAQRLVELMGGRIEVSSTKGKGSRFTIWLPAITGTVDEPD
ncbi:MAG: ATP-binding protein [Rhodothermus sp.]|nr:ATP-binding protein [Rhodothermus sp.]